MTAPISDSGGGAANAGPIRLRRLAPGEVNRARQPAVPPEIIGPTLEIIANLREGGETALRRYAERWDGLAPGAPLVHTPRELTRALESLPAEDRGVLERTARRIEHFARAQRASVAPVEVAVEGGRAGDEVVPVESAGCYAPGGRFPLPSSVLMTAVTARVAGVREIWVTSPRPSRVVMAAAAVAGVEGLGAVGGAQAVAALAFGIGPLPRCDVVVGPGNQWVTAAKLLLSGVVGIDLLAGPSELAILSDEEGNPALIAADLLAQAEHDPVALPVLITTSAELVERVESELARQLTDLPTAPIAIRALRNGFTIVAPEDDALHACETLAPEHLQLHGSRVDAWRPRLSRHGALFIGESTAEVIGDYGAGPNHTLPTGGTARFTGGLSVHNFLRRPNWLAVGSTPDAHRLARDCAALARMEGLEGHARAAIMRSGESPQAHPSSHNISN